MLTLLILLVLLLLSGPSPADALAPGTPHIAPESPRVAQQLLKAPKSWSCDSREDCYNNKECKDGKCQCQDSTDGYTRFSGTRCEISEANLTLRHTTIQLPQTTSLKGLVRLNYTYYIYPAENSNIEFEIVTAKLIQDCTSAFLYVSGYEPDQNLICRLMDGSIKASVSGDHITIIFASMGLPASITITISHGYVHQTAWFYTNFAWEKELATDFSQQQKVLALNKTKEWIEGVNNVSEQCANNFRSLDFDPGQYPRYMFNFPWIDPGSKPLLKTAILVGFAVLPGNDTQKCFQELPNLSGGFGYASGKAKSVKLCLNNMNDIAPDQKKHPDSLDSYTC